jgi:hypothetical protein
VLGQSGSVWEGASGAPIAGVLRGYSRRLTRIEETLVDCMRAVESWREGLERRQSQVADLVAAVVDTSADPEAQDRRTRLLAVAREVGAEHDRAAAQLGVAFEDLSGTIAELDPAEDDLATELSRALAALSRAVESWVEAEAAELIRTALALREVAGLTVVISELVGIAALGRTPGEPDGVGEIIARSPASHRLVQALQRRWSDLAPSALTEASFATVGATPLADRLEGKAGRTQPAGGADGTDGTDT